MPYRFSFFADDVRHVWIRFYQTDDMEEVLTSCKYIAVQENPNACAFLIESDQDSAEVRKSGGLDF